MFQQDLDSIISGFTKTKRKLDDFCKRKMDEACAKEAEICELEQYIDKCKADTKRAGAISKKLEEFLA